MNLKPFRIIRNIFLGWIPGGTKYCIFCKNKVWGFYPYRNGLQAPLMKELKYISGDLSNFGCPRCGSNDRERHLFLYMKKLGILQNLNESRILHFAPEPKLSKHIEKYNPKKYIKCDLYPTSTEIVKENIEEISFPDNSFDILIANHVLEHVQNDTKAIEEIQRVLAPGGIAILQTPYSSILNKTWQDDGILDYKSRLQAYGQEDHVRLYGNDIFDKFTSSGLINDVKWHNDVLLEISPTIYGVSTEEPFLLFRKT